MNIIFFRFPKFIRKLKVFHLTKTQFRIKIFQAQQVYDPQSKIMTRKIILTLAVG